MASKHKDPKMLRKYVHEDLNSRLSTPNIISSSIVKDRMEKAIAEEEWVDEDLELIKTIEKNRYSSNVMSTSTVDALSSTVLAAAAASDKVEKENQESAK